MAEPPTNEPSALPIPPPWLTRLLPIFGVTVLFRFQAPADLGFYHQPVVRGWLNNLLPKTLGEQHRVWLHTPESGRALYRTGDLYRLQLFCCRGGESVFERLLLQLQAPGRKAGPPSAPLRLSSQLAYRCLEDWLTGSPCDTLQQVAGYDVDSFSREIAFWRQHPNLRIRLLTPIRMLLPEQDRHGVKGENRFVRDRGEMPPGLFLQRIVDAIHHVCRDEETAYSPPVIPPTPQSDTLFWVDDDYGNPKKPMGGLLGRIDLRLPADGLDALMPYLVLGQHLGVGQRRTFGWGRYRLETADGRGTTMPRAFSRSILQRAADLANLEQADRFVRDHHRRSADDFDEEFIDFSDEAAAAAEDDPADADLEALAQAFKTDAYHVPPLHGAVLRQPGKAPRPLAIPPLRDRVAQRAVVEILTPDVESLMSRGSYGFRRGLSRRDAKDRIQRLYREGYRWFYESDIEDFFDSVSHELLEDRLRSLFTDDSAVDLILRWVRAPVRFQGETIERRAGLPQGSPISPLLANLMLTDFDADLKANGMALVRFADDFVIVCKSRERAEQAATQSEASLAELGLTVNPDKTRIGRFDQGFHFLGYVFVNELAVDATESRKQPPRPLTLENLPPRNWLAHLARRRPALLETIGSGAKSERTPMSAAPEQHEIGEIGTEGTIVYVTGQGVKLSLRQGRLHIADPAGSVRSLSFNELAAVVLIGRHNMTTPTLTAALDRDVPVYFLTAGGRYRGALHSPTTGHTGHHLWLRQKERFADEPAALALAVAVVDARLHNQIEVLRQRRSGAAEPIDRTLYAIARSRRQLQQCASLSELNGYEGGAAAAYFAVLSQLLPEPFRFQQRSRRPPRDPFNALLSLGYTILYANIDSLLRVSGLLPWCGFYHQPHGRHATLASDLLEPFRHIVERSALSMINRRQLKEADFLDAGAEGIRLTRPALRLYLGELSRRLYTPIVGRNDERPQTFYEHAMKQNRSLIEWLRGARDDLHCFRLK